MLDARSVLPVTTVLVVLCSIHPVAQYGGTPRVILELRVSQWVELVKQHEPGRGDAALRSLQRWPETQLQQLRSGLARVNDRNSQFPVKSAGELRQLLRSGAVLHADLAVLGRVHETSTDQPERSRPGSVLVDDGQYAGYAANSVHWEIGRLLINMLQDPGPRPDEFVSLWFRASTEFMIAGGDYASTQSHLGFARQLLADEAHVWLASGVVRAYYATPNVQNALAHVKVPFGFEVMVNDERTELNQAERFLSRAVELEPGNAEAQTRLGWVLVQQKRLDAALNALRAAQDTATEPVLQYYASLFLGVAAGATGNYETATNAFEHAARLFPNAQAPLLGSSDLAMRRGDRVAAAAALERLLALPVGTRDDPWWTYNVEYGRHWRATVDRLYELLRQSAR